QNAQPTSPPGNSPGGLSAFGEETRSSASTSIAAAENGVKPTSGQAHTRRPEVPVDADLRQINGHRR
ncbi:hypothetical protein ACUN0C_17035, partial [Faunimonas sp. B44]|uniref:hypothetical protein n=1 Tax=Faunimonas sp. B44 TaxID=3461493 RepID=UPI0040440171